MVIAIIELFTIILKALDPTQRTFLHRLHKEEIWIIRVPEISDMLRHICRIGDAGPIGVYLC